MDLKKNYVASQEARAFIQKTHAAAGGWDVHGTDKITGEVSFLYCFDLATGFNWMCCAALETLNDVSQEVLNQPAVWPDVLQQLDTAIGSVIAYVRMQHCVTKAKSGNLPKPSQIDFTSYSDHLSRLVSGFSGISRHSHNGLKFKASHHFIAVRYTPQKHCNVIRSISIPAEQLKINAVLSMDELHFFIKSLVDKDKLDHPEWFE